MKKVLIILLLFIAGCAGEENALTSSAMWILKTTARGYAVNQRLNKAQSFIAPNPLPSQNLQIDAYGPNIHMNEFGQAVTLWPDFGGISGEVLKITPNAYGPGLHMDQYGRVVREYPWP